jgi:hypothetical protein
VRKTRRTEITVETKQVLVVRKLGVPILAWCPGCAAEAKMVTPDEAAAITCTNSRMIYRWVEAEKVHSTETADGATLICLNSLPK